MIDGLERHANLCHATDRIDRKVEESVRRSYKRQIVTDTKSRNASLNGFRGGWTKIARLENLSVFKILLATLELKEVSKEKTAQAQATKL